ncbi:MAG: peptide deformylase [Halorhodospira sp.]
MALLDILIYPDPRLRERAEPVAEVDDGVRRFVDDMLETMYEAQGIGLAATQVGDRRRVVVIDLSEERDGPRVLINPQILERAGEITGEEGCLSIPGYYDEVSRSAWIRYRALDRDGQPYEEEAEGLLATCIQHEVDHLEGRLFIDYLSELKRKRVRKRMEKRERHVSAAG